MGQNKRSRKQGEGQRDTPGGAYRIEMGCCLGFCRTLLGHRFALQHPINEVFLDGQMLMNMKELRKGSVQPLTPYTCLHFLQSVFVFPQLADQPCTYSAEQNGAGSGIALPVKSQS
jgi:hypothetical protein